MPKEILVHIDSTQASEKRTDVAIHLAKAHGARLSGLHVPWHKAPVTWPERGIGDVKDRFLKKVNDAGIEGRWVDVSPTLYELDVEEIFKKFALFADLVVIGQHQPGVSDRICPKDLVEKVVVGCGRPVLVVPYESTEWPDSHQVMIAWKAGSRATRAVHDAIDLLRSSNKVHVTTIASQEISFEDGRMMVEHLEQHGVKAVANPVRHKGLSFANALLGLAAEKRIDIMVMGACVRQRKGRLEFGDLSKTVLEQMTVPVLMSL